MQNYTEISQNEELLASLAMILNNDKTALSCSSGTAFPTANVQVGQLCFRTDQNKLYQTKDGTTWLEVADLSKSFSQHKDDLVGRKEAGALTILRGENLPRYNRHVATQTGTIAIKLPTRRNAAMLTMRIRGFNYAQDKSAWDLDIGGYLYATGWYNVSANSKAQLPFGTTVRFAEDANYSYILLGTTATVWSYPRVWIEEVMIGYAGDALTSNAADYAISLLTDESTLTIQQTVTINTGVNVESATKLQTARTINGVSFNGTANITVADATKLPLTGGTLTGTLNVSGNAGSFPLRVRGITGTDGGTTPVHGPLYLQYGANNPVHFGNAGSYTISSDGSQYSGNAATATKLATARTIAISGDATGSANFDGSANATISISLNNKGVAGGLATLDTNGKVYADQLPSYVDDILEFANLAAFPVTGEPSKIYMALDTNLIYRWSGTTYVGISSGSGTVDAALKLANARLIGGVSFDGTANINLPGVNVAGNQNTSGNAATATTSTNLKGTDNRTIKPIDVTKSAVSSFFTSQGGLTGDAGNSVYGDFLTLNTYKDITGGKVNGLLFLKGSKSIVHYQAAQGDTTWGAADTLAYLSSNVASATKLETARTITVGRTGKTFDGSADVSWTHDEVLPTGTNGQVLKHNGTGWVAGTDNNTTYSAMSQAEADAGTATTSRVITAAVLKAAIQTHAPTPTDITGNAATATKLQTARTINGVSFDGSANITVADSTKLPLSGGTLTGEVTQTGAFKWRISAADTAHQRADARDDATNFARLHWYGVSDTGATSNFRHAWFDGAGYIDVTAASGTASFGGSISATRNIGSPTTGTMWQEGKYQISVVNTDAGRAVVNFHRSGYSNASLYHDGDGIKVDANFMAEGNITAYSDIRLKDNIKGITGAIEKVAKLNGITYTRKDLEDKATRFMGLSAQEVQAVAPEAVSVGRDENKTLSVDYQGLTGLLVEAIKDLNSKLEQQAKLIDKQRELIENLLQSKS